MKNRAAQELGRLSAKKQGIHDMTPEERSNYMKQVRAGKRIKPTEQEILPIDNNDRS